MFERVFLTERGITPNAENTDVQKGSEKKKKTERSAAPPERAALQRKMAAANHEHGNNAHTQRPPTEPHKHQVEAVAELTGKK